MKVKDVIISALRALGRNSVAAALSSGAELSADDSETVEALLYCYNAAEDEVARCYSPLTKSQTFTSTNNKFIFLMFDYTPVNIVSVKSEGKEIPFTLNADHVYAEAFKVEITYEYAPAKKQISDLGSFDGEVGEYALVYGTVAEYCLINGEIEAADMWESKYRQSLDKAQSARLEGNGSGKLHSGGYIPPRRWV